MRIPSRLRRRIPIGEPFALAPSLGLWHGVEIPKLIEIKDQTNGIAIIGGFVFPCGHCASGPAFLFPERLLRELLSAGRWGDAISFDQTMMEHFNSEARLAETIGRQKFRPMRESRPNPQPHRAGIKLHRRAAPVHLAGLNSSNPQRF